MILTIGTYVLKIIYFFLKLLPTSKKITLISRQMDTPTIDFMILKKYFNENLKDYKVVILTKRLEKGSKATYINKIKYFFHMLRQMYHLATSRVVILDTYCIAVSILKHKKKLLIIQMWHAIGSMKKFGYAMIDKKEGTSSKIAKKMKMHNNYNYALISSYSFIKDYIEGFNITKDKIVEIPLPRVDLLTNKEYIKYERKNLYKKYPKLKNKKNILYSPTFRKKEKGVSKAINNLIENIDFTKYNLIVSLHPLSKKIQLPKNVIVTDEPTFKLLFITDYLISDYSSVIYEAGLLNIPFLHYAYDWDTYKNVRELNLNLKKESPGLFTDDPKKIIKYIEKEKFNKEKYEKFIKKNVKVDNVSACEKILNLIMKNIEEEE